MVLPPFARFLIRAIVRTVLVLIFLGIPSGLVLLKTLGFGDTIRDQVASALGTGPIETTIGRLSFDVIEGLVAEDVHIFLREPSPEKIVSINRVSVVPSLADLLVGRVHVERISLSEATAQIPLRDEESKTVLYVEDLSADLQIEDGNLLISNFDGVLQGVRVRLTGGLTGLDDLRLAPGGGETGMTARLRKWLETFDTISFPGSMPVLSAHLAGSPSDPASLTLDPVTIGSGPIVGDGWRFESLEASFAYEGGKWSVERLILTDEVGRLRLWAQGDRSVAEADVECSLSAAQFLALFDHEALSTLELQGRPRIFARLTADLTSSPAKIAASGSLDLEDFSFRGVKASHLSAEFAWRDGKLFIRDADLQAAGGHALLSLLMEGNDVRIRGSSTIKPTALAPALDGKTREMLAEMEFADPPDVHVSLRGPSLDFAKMTGEGTLRLGRTAMRGVWVDSLSSQIDIGDGAITYRNFTIVKAKTRGTGSFTYDFKGQQVRLRDIVSTMNPVEVMMWVDPRIAETISDYRFREPPTIRGGGVIYMHNPARNDLRLEVESSTGFDYDLLGKTLPFGRTSASVNVIATSVKAHVRRAALFGGQISVKADVSIDPRRPVFSADINVNRVDFAKLTKLYFDYEGSKGVGSGSYSFRAPLANPERMAGQGSLRVEDGNVFAIPLLGPLSEVINKILPGAGYENANLATCDFSIANERIQTKNLEIEGSGFTLFGEGVIFFMSDRMDMAVRINARGVPGIVFFPVSKLLEYSSTGTISQPEWRPKIIPRFPTLPNGR